MKTTGIAMLFLLLFCEQVSSQNLSKGDDVHWLMSELLQHQSSNIQIKGNPTRMNSRYGQAVYFNGVSDALFVDDVPLKSLKEFTVEMIFYPDTAAAFEQRVLHIGEIAGDRMLLEIRAVDRNWYLDGFVASKGNKKVMIDEQRLHPLAQWYHVAFVVSPDRLTTFVNGKQELSEAFLFMPIESGRTSIAVRQNEKSWFKGMIYKIKITPKLLKPEEFMTTK